MEISQVSKATAEEYVRVLKQLITTTIKLPQEAIENFATQWTVERLNDCAETWVFLLARENGRTLGVILGTPPEGGVGTIVWVLVDSKLQKKGVGTALFSEACQIYRAKGAHKIKLTVPDEETVNFYLKQGMTLEGIHRKHWWNADFWSMGIQLNKTT